MYKNILDTIGNTPLVELDFNNKGKIFAKLEYLNPGGSVKDRSALFMIEEAERLGLLKPGYTIIDASSGNHAISVAMIGAIKNYKVIISVSEKISKEKLQAIKGFGAQVIVCPPSKFIDDPDSYHAKALEIQKNTPNSFMPNQYFNISNALAHYTLLGPEIWKQTNGKITHFISAAGTGGTISGVGRFLKEKNPKIKVIAVDSVNSFRSTKGNPKPYKVEGMGVDFVSPVLDERFIDEFFCVTDEEAINILKDMSYKHALLVGPTSGAVAYAGKKYSQELDSDSLCVMIFGDSGRAYLTRNYYE